MKAMSTKIIRSLNFGARINAADNSGAKTLRIISVIGIKTRKGRIAAAGIGNLIQASVIEGKLGIRKQVVYAVIVRQKKEFKRKNGLSVGFEDNAAVVLKDDKGSPRGTILKGPIAKEVGERWPAITKLASIVV